ncbi:MAG: acyltransferase [Alphaproteobacteria bacterium]
MSLVNRLYRRACREWRGVRRRVKRLHLKLYGQIDVHPRAVVEPGARLVLTHPSDREHVISIGPGSTIKDDVCLFPRNGYITIGAHCSINPYCILLGYGGIEIEDYVRIAAHCSIVAFNHVFEDSDEPILRQGNVFQGVKIRRNVWIGTGVRILDGVEIGSGSVIAAGAVVTRDIPPNSVAMGVPARAIRTRKNALPAEAASIDD